MALLEEHDRVVDEQVRQATSSAGQDPLVSVAFPRIRMTPRRADAAILWHTRRVHFRFVIIS
jgi:hypothetical protein